jgi:hypothetical protein
MGRQFALKCGQSTLATVLFLSSWLTYFSNASYRIEKAEQRKVPLGLCLGWRGRRDSNPQPPDRQLGVTGNPKSGDNTDLASKDLPPLDLVASNG